MPKSEIFDLYEKIAEENGLISSAADEEENEFSQPEKPKESAKLKKYKKSPAPRAGSDDISTIEALYGVKPDSPMKYEWNIMEVAHPNAVVIGPAYDRLNALVENNIERQNIISNIVMGPTGNGSITHHRYAEKDLLMQLIRIASDMDNKGCEELRKIADSCIDELTEKKSLKKVAILPWIIGGAIVLAGIWLWSHMNDPDQGLMANIDAALKELDDLKTNSWYESDVDGIVQRDVDIIEKNLMSLKKYVQSFNSVLDTVYKPTSLTESKELSALKTVSESKGEVVNSAIESFISSTEEVIPLLITAINNFTSSAYQKEHTSPSWLSQFTGWIGEALHGRWGLIANDFISAANALSTLKGSLEEAYRRALNIDQIKEKNQESIQNSIASLRQKSTTKTMPGATTNETAGVGGEEDEEFVPSGGVKEEKGSDGGFGDVFNMIGYKPSAEEMETLNKIK